MMPLINNCFKKYSLLFGVIILANLPALGQGYTKKIHIKKRDKFLNLPVKRSEDLKKIQIIEDGAVLDELTIRLADKNPDFWTFFDVSNYEGKTITLQSDNDIDISAGFKLVFVDSRFPGQDSLYNEKYRQQLHFSSRRGWNNDPNGLIYYHGEYHMYYQHNPYGWSWGNMHWGHAVSKDLISWKELNDALYDPAHDHMAFSGSASVDTLNTSRFSKDGVDPLIAAYTRTGSGEHLALSYDDGRTFKAYQGNPIIKHKGRDPQLFWYEPGHHWVIVVYDESHFRKIGQDKKARIYQNAIYTSPDLKHWAYQSAIPGFFECPELFKISVEGETGVTKWVMYDGDGTYVVGNFDGKKFTVEQSLKKYDYGGSFYASQMFDNVPDHRHIQVGWFRGLETKHMPFNQCMTFPTTLVLRKTEHGYRLCPHPIKKIAKLYQDTFDFKNRIIKPGSNLNTDIASSQLHVTAEFNQGDAHQFGLNINGYKLVYDQLGGYFNDTYYPISADKSVNIEVIVDKMSMEVFVNDGGLYYVLPYNSVDAEKKLEVFAGGDTKSKAILKKLEVQKLKSIWD